MQQYQLFPLQSIFKLHDIFLILWSLSKLHVSPKYSVTLNILNSIPIIAFQ